MKLCFKGDRNYLHGTDIFNYLIYKEVNSRNVNQIDLSFHNIAYHQIELSYEEPEEKDKLCFLLKYNEGSSEDFSTIYGCDNGHIIDCRHDYNESHIISQAHYNSQNQSIDLNSETGYSFVENVVSMNKKLLSTLFPDIDRKWYFTRLQIENVQKVENILPIQLKFKRDFNMRLTKTDIYLQGFKQGSIFFSTQKSS